jgi:hypothetical protein
VSLSATPEERLAEENRRLRQELAAWQSQAQVWQSQKQALQTQVQELESIRRNLEHTVAVYQRCLFGSRSEKLDPQELEARIATAAAEARAQLAREKRPGDPPPEAEEEQPEAKAAVDQPADQEQKRKARPHGRNPLPAHLPRRRIEHPVDPAQALCAGCPEHPPLIKVGGRRNWLHVGQEAGGEKAANLFSLMITCKRLGVEPYAYLHDILRRLPSHPNKDIWQLTPRGWKGNMKSTYPQRFSL